MVLKAARGAASSLELHHVQRRAARELQKLQELQKKAALLEHKQHEKNSKRVRTGVGKSNAHSHLLLILSLRLDVTSPCIDFGFHNVHRAGKT